MALRPSVTAAFTSRDRPETVSVTRVCRPSGVYRRAASLSLRAAYQDVPIPAV